MAVSSTNRIAGPFSGAGTTGPFPFAFRVFQASDLFVVRTNADGTRDVLSVSVGFTAEINTDQNSAPGGELTLTDALPVGASLVFTTALDALQLMRLTNAGGFYPEAIEQQLDYLTILIQQHDTALAQTLRVPEVAGIPELPDKQARALTIQMYDADGDPVCLPAVEGDATELALVLAGDAGAGMIGFDPSDSYPAGSVGASLVDALQGQVAVVDTVAALVAYTGDTSVVMTRGYWTTGDGGGATYILQPDTPSPGGNEIDVIDRADGRWYRLHIPGEYLPSRQAGIKGDESTGETARLDAALRRCWTTLKKGFLVQGRPRLDACLLIDYPVHIKFEGAISEPSDSGASYGNSYFRGLNTATSLQALVSLTHPGIYIEGGGVVGDWSPDAPGDGWQTDGVFIGAHGVRWAAGQFKHVGRDGVRVGDFVGGPGTNSNTAYLDKCHASYVGRHGANLSDEDSPADANALLITSFEGKDCGGYGIHVGVSGLGVTIVAPNCERNDTGGLYVSDSAIGSVVVVGGDFEDNGPTGFENVIDASNGTRLFLVGVHDHSTMLNSAPKLDVRANQPTATLLTLQNTNTASNASAQLKMTTSAGNGGLWQLSEAAGGWFLVGTTHDGPVGLMVNDIIRFGFNADGSLGIGGFSGVGTSGYVLTSQGPGAPPIWAAGGGGGGSSPLTTKGDLYGRSASGDARLPVGSNGQILSADSAEATGLKWVTPAYVAKAGDTMTGDLVVSKSDATLQATASTGNANLVAATAGGITGGVRSGGGAVEVGSISSHDTRLLSNNTARITLFTSGNVEVNTSSATLYLTGLPTSSPGVAGAVWRDGSGYLRIA